MIQTLRRYGIFALVVFGALVASHAIHPLVHDHSIRGLDSCVCDNHGCGETDAGDAEPSGSPAEHCLLADCLALPLIETALFWAAVLLLNEVPTETVETVAITPPSESAPPSLRGPPSVSHA